MRACSFTLDVVSVSCGLCSSNGWRMLPIPSLLVLQVQLLDGGASVAARASSAIIGAIADKATEIRCAEDDDSEPRIIVD